MRDRSAEDAMATLEAAFPYRERITAVGLDSTEIGVKLRVVERLADLPPREMIAQRLCVTINSDDPAYFGGYIDDNYRAIAHAFNFGSEQLAAFARNGIEAAFLDEKRRLRYLAELDLALAS